jgi:hypothetical protein
MKIHRLSSSLLCSFVTASLMVVAASRVTANPRAACDVLSLAEVRSLVGAQMAVFEAGSSPATTRGDSTVSTCTYVLTDAGGHPAKGLGAKFTLMWAPKATLAQSNDFYTKRHIEASGMKGDVLAVAWVGSPSDGKAGDWAASQRLLAAVLQKL